MVKLVEIEDDAVFDDDSQYTTDEDENESIASLTDKGEEDESDFDFDEEDDEFEETFLERVQALKDIIPIEKRRAFSSAISNISYWGTFGLHLAGKLSWVFTTSALLVVFPLALESDREKMMQQWESEQAGGIPGGQQQPMGGMLPPGVAGSAPGIVA